MNRTAALLRKPKRLVKQGAQASPNTCRRLRIVETSARASAAKSHRDRFNLQWPATSAAGIDAARKDSRRRAVEMAGAPADAYVLERQRRRGLPWRRAWRIPRDQTLQAVQNTVIHQAPCVNRAAAHLQKPGRLAERRGARAFRTTRQLLIVEASARASAAKSRRDRFNLQ